MLADAPTAGPSDLAAAARHPYALPFRRPHSLLNLDFPAASAFARPRVPERGPMEALLRAGSSLQSDDRQYRRITPTIEVLAALRLATSDRHSRVDQVMPLSRAGATHADYLEHVRLMRAWLDPLECWLGIGFRQIELIDADLAESDSQPPSETASSGAGRWLPASTAAYRWGARYVIEGSRLGAAVLYRRLRFTMNPHALHYLRGDPEASADRWPAFLRELNAAVQTPADISEACQGARDAFDALLAATEAHA